MYQKQMEKYDEIVATDTNVGSIKTADEMFKEIDFEKIVDNETEVIYKFEKKLMGDRCIHHIMFAKVSKLVFSYGEDIEENCGIGIQEQKAINKKVEELGWK